MYVTVMHQPVIVFSSTCSQMHVQTKHSLAHLQDLIPTLASTLYKVCIKVITLIKVGIISSKCARECFICTCILGTCVTVANSYRLAHYSYITGLNRQLDLLLFIVIPTSFFNYKIMYYIS